MDVLLKISYMNTAVCLFFLFLDDSLKYVTIIPVGSAVSEVNMQALVSLMQLNCEQSSKFTYRSISSPEAEKLLHSIHKTLVPSNPATATASTVVHASTPVTAMPVTAARLLVTRQPGCITSPAPQVKIIIGSMEMLRNLSACVPAEGRDEEAEMADRSRSPSPFHPIFNGPVVR